MRIGLITYNKPHLKTQQLFHGFLKKNFSVSFFITPFKKYNKKKVENKFPHRPYQFVGEDIKILAEKYKIRIFKISEIVKLQNAFDYFIVAGSGILPKPILKEKIINCHSGLIPFTRGLDSFKWAILKMHQLGNTLHFINEDTDLGKIIYQEYTEVLSHDNYNTLSKRHYENEINLLINFKYFLDNPNNMKLKNQKNTFRMNASNEEKMMQNFEKYIKKFSK